VEIHYKRAFDKVIGPRYRTSAPAAGVTAERRLGRAAKGWSMTDPNSPHAGGPPDRRSFGQ